MNPPVSETKDQDFLKDSEDEDVSHVPSVKIIATTSRNTLAKKVTPYQNHYPHRRRSGEAHTVKK